MPESWGLLFSKNVNTGKIEMGYVNTLRVRQISRQFPDIFKCIFLNENMWISIKISLKLVHTDPINNIPSLVQIMAWRRPDNKPLSEPTRTTRMSVFWEYLQPPMITHTIDSYQIPSQNKTKSKLQIWKIWQKLKFLNFAKIFTWNTPSEVAL